MQIVFILLFMALSLIVSKWLFGSYLSPLAVLGWAWGLSLLLYSIEFSSASPLSRQSWVLIFGSWLGFLVGGILVGLRGKTNHSRQKKTRNVGLSEKYFKIMRFFAIISVLGSVRFALSVLSQAGLTSWLNNSINLRHSMTLEDFNTGSLTYVFQGITMASAVLGGVAAAFRPRFGPAYLPILAAALFDLFFFGRAHIITVLLIFLSSLLLSLPLGGQDLGKFIRRHYRRIVIVGFVFVGIPMGFITQSRGRELSFSNLARLIQDYTGNFTQTWYLLDALGTRQSFLSGGINTFFPFSMLLYRLGVLDQDPRINRLFAEALWVPSGRTSNTYTLLGSVYADFGLLGSWLLFFLLGLLLNYLFLRYCRNPQLVRISILSFIYPTLILSVQSNIFGAFAPIIGLVMAVTCMLIWGQYEEARPRATLHHRYIRGQK